VKRLAAKALLLVAVCFVVAYAAILLRNTVFTGFPKEWMPGVYGAIGATFGLGSLRWFDKRWPKPREGWAK
jgi:hypothetical protein